MTLALQRERGPVRPLPTYVPPGASAVLALRADSCRWPLGEADQDDFRFCLEPAGHKAYCAIHGRMARRSGR